MKIKIKAKPNSKEEKIEKISELEYIVSVKEPPVKGLANKAIIEALADYFNIPKYQIRIISGFTSRDKIIEKY
jgi:hypothetical protein